MIANRMLTLASVLVTGLLLAGCGPAEHDDVVLRDDGLAIVGFGDGVESTLTALVEALGEPSIDQLLTPPWPDTSLRTGTRLWDGCTGASGYRCVAYLRRVVWKRWGLAVVFSDLKAFNRMGSPIVIDPHFVVWEHWQPPGEEVFSTESGIGPGSSMGDLRAAHVEDLVDMSIGCPEGNGWVHQDVTAIGDPSSGPHIAPGNDSTMSELQDDSVPITYMWAGFHKDCRPGHPFLDPGPGPID